MVSLNEKRSKIRYVVQNKTEWTDDTNKFGKRMLEKMGWTSGSGLGKNEDGRTEHIDVKYKSNLKGVGFVNGKYDDTWLAHSHSFDTLLQQLQQSHSTSSSSNSLQDFHQNVQQTKTRFTYKKQSSGKDLSSRTNKELDCIFGWNKINQNNTEKTEEKADEINEEETTSTNLYITSKQSISDYFKEKSKLKYQQTTVDETLTNQNKRKISESSQDIELSENTKKNKETNGEKDIENPYPNSNLLDLNGYEGWSLNSSFENIKKKKEKKKKRNK